MALKFRHINTQQTLNTIKFSADSTNATYFLHSSTSTQQQGTPDVNYEDICFIKPTGQLYTHGKLYNGENNNNYADGYLDYLHKLCTKNNKNAIILSGGEKYKNGITEAFVYIDNVGIKSVSGLHSDSSTSNTDYKITLYTILNAYRFIPSTSNLTDNEELVCDWADLARLSDLEIPMATRYQNGLVKVDSELSSSSTNPIANNVLYGILQNLSFKNTFSYDNQYSQHTSGLTDDFLREFCSWAINTGDSNIHIGTLRPSVSGVVIGMEYASGAYSAYLYLGTDGKLVFFGKTGNTFFRQDLR